MSFGPTDSPVWVQRVSNSFLHLINFCQLESLILPTQQLVFFFNFLTANRHPSFRQFTWWDSTGVSFILEDWLLSSSFFHCFLLAPFSLLCAPPQRQLLSHVFATPWTTALQTPVHGILQARIGDLPNPEIELWSPALQEDYLPLSYQGSPAPQNQYLILHVQIPALFSWLPYHFCVKGSCLKILHIIFVPQLNTLSL